MSKEPEDHAAIKGLARTCARKNLSLREAVWLFESMYFTDCLVLSAGNAHKAAEIAGTRPAIFSQQIQRHHERRETERVLRRGGSD